MMKAFGKNGVSSGGRSDTGRCAAFVATAKYASCWYFLKAHEVGRKGEPREGSTERGSDDAAAAAAAADDDDDDANPAASANELDSTRPETAPAAGADDDAEFSASDETAELPAPTRPVAPVVGPEAAPAAGADDDAELAASDETAESPESTRTAAPGIESVSWSSKFSTAVAVKTCYPRWSCDAPTPVRRTSMCGPYRPA